MADQKRRVEVYSAGCSCCEQVITQIKEVACPSCEVTVHDMRQPEVAEHAERLGIRSVPTVVIDGKLAGCCSGRGTNPEALRAAGLGVSL